MLLLGMQNLTVETFS